MEIFKRKFKTKNTWMWFRWRETNIEFLDDYFRFIMGLKNIPYFSHGDVENFERLEFKQLRGHYLIRMTNEALKRKSGGSPHTKVQKFLLENDPHTVASEIPVYSKKYGLTGFIDIIRVLDFYSKTIEILDFKPNNSHKNVDLQLQKYRFMLAERLNISEDNIVVGYFNEGEYFREVF